MVTVNASTTTTKVMSGKTSKSGLTTRTTTTSPDEFGGPIGTLLTTIALPFLVMLLIHWAKVGYLDLNGPLEHPVDIFCPSCQQQSDSVGTFLLYLYCTIGLLGWFGFLVVLWIILPGPWVEGCPIKDNINSNNDTSSSKQQRRLSYKINGHATFWVVVAIVIGLQLPLNEYLYRYYEPLALCDIVLSILLATYVYVGSYWKDEMTGGNRVLSHTGNSGHPSYDFFMGRELNPRNTVNLFGKRLSFDWKEFCELRPGLIGWMLLNYACLQEQYYRTGSVSGSMVLLNIFHAIYVWDALYQERAILSTMDITTDGFGFMLVFGDLTWVPFTYNLPARYLVHHDPHLSIPVLLIIMTIYGLGYFIFRSSNLQKDIFRNDPTDVRVSHLTYLPTKRGTRLLTSGWWGMARKINYTGDYLMGLTYSLLCGVQSIVPYYYAIYFAILLIHRSIRDDVLCQEKYGDDWQEYKRLVPYRFIPGVV